MHYDFQYGWLINLICYLPLAGAAAIASRNLSGGEVGELTGQGKPGAGPRGGWCTCSAIFDSR